MGPLCQKALVQHVAKHKDSYSRGESEILAESILRLADTAGYPEGIRSQLEVAAASLSRTDDVLRRMQTYGSSSSENLVTQGARMMAASGDPRATGLLMDLLGRYARNSRMLSGKVLIDVGMKLGPQGYTPILAFLSLARDPQERVAVLQSAAYTQDPRAMGLLLREYGDSLRGIRDSTSSAVSPEEKARYFWLLHCTCLLEPTLHTSLSDSSGFRRRQAVELLDRGSRYGTLHDYPAMEEALDRAVAHEPTMRQRVTEIRRRFEHWESEKASRQG